MSQKRRVVTIHLPRYQRDRAQWRKDILDRVREKQHERSVHYSPEETFEVKALLYLGTKTKQKRFAVNDVDNRLKDILDALQGRLGRSRTKQRLIENDNRILRVVIEKRLSPKNPNIRSGGWLTIRPFRYRRVRWSL